MLLNKLFTALLFALAATAFASADADNSLTIYNQNFAVIRQPLALNLTAGENHVTVTDVTAQLEPDSVVLRDPSGARALSVLEQNYLADPISKGRLLDLAVGKTIDFVTADGKLVPGKVIRSGYISPFSQNNPYGEMYQYSQEIRGDESPAQPIIEVDGKLQFGLPGEPHFDSLSADAILKPTIDWTLTTDRPGPCNAELSYISDGLNWEASYNLVAPESGGPIDLTAWVTMENDSGRTFDNAAIKLMAGDINKVDVGKARERARSMGGAISNMTNPNTPVTEKAFDDYHLYSITRPTTLRDGETKQVEFAHSSAVDAKTTYTYDGLKIDPNRYNGWSYENYRNQQDYGTQSNAKVWIVREFKNSATNGLGIALPKGKTRFYQRDSDGHIEFLGEDEIDHTPANEMVHLRTGNAFDIVGERTQTSYTIQNRELGNSFVDESFKITLRNHKTTPVDVHIVEHLYRGENWTITEKSDTFLKTDAQTMEFLVTVPPDDSKVVTYTAHYTW